MALTRRPNRNPILALMRDDFGGEGDPWGTALGWAFGVAEVLHYTGHEVPAEMQYRPGLTMPAYDGEGNVVFVDYPDARIAELYRAGELTTDDLEEAARLLSRYCDWLRAAGLDY